MKCEFTEAEFEHGASRFDNDAFSPMLRMEDVPDRSFALLGIRYMEAASAYQRVVRTQYDREIINAARNDIRSGYTELDVLETLGKGARVIRLEANHIGISLVSVGGLGVRLFELAEQEAFCKKVHEAEYESNEVDAVKGDVTDADGDRPRVFVYEGRFRAGTNSNGLTAASVAADRTNGPTVFPTSWRAKPTSASHA